MPAPRKYPKELRDPSMSPVVEAMTEVPSVSVKRIGDRVGVVPDTLRGWVKQRQIDTGARAVTTTGDATRIKDLEREVKDSSMPTRSCWRPRASSRESSTRDCRSSRVHRRTPVRTRGRADLSRAQRARLPERPADLLRRQDPGAVGAGPARCRVFTRGDPRPQCASGSRWS